MACDRAPFVSLNVLRIFTKKLALLLEELVDIYRSLMITKEFVIGLISLPLLNQLARKLTSIT